MSETINVGERVDILAALRLAKEEAERKVKDINEEISKIEYEIISAMEEQGTDRVSNSSGTVSLKVEMYPQVEDMESLVNWCAENNRPDMIQKRVSSTAFKEYFEEMNEFPDGIKTYEKKSLGFRKR